MEGFHEVIPSYVETQATEIEDTRKWGNRQASLLPVSGRGQTLDGGFGSSSGGGVVVKKGGKQAGLPPRGVFVVVVVVVADKESGTPSGTSCRPAAALRCTPKRQGRQNTGEGGADTL
ncbi:MAG: hypothetical protein J0L63_01440 [Anaerolineae bacterium]|nr:hypothetical protein [Anaerolineae bacterium]